MNLTDWKNRSGEIQFYMQFDAADFYMHIDEDVAKLSARYSAVAEQSCDTTLPVRSPIASS